MNKTSTNTFKKKINNKFCFVGISLSPSAQNETGISVLDRDLNLLRVDKVYNINELQPYIKNLAPADSILVCVDLPKNVTMTNGKWRIDAKNTSTFKIDGIDDPRYSWAERFSDRGSDFCETLDKEGIETYRYYGYFAKNTLKLNSPYKSRTPAACKHLQMSIQNVLKVSGIPSNLIPLSGLDAIIGAYTAWRIANTYENEGYKVIGTFNNKPIITPL